MTEWQFVEDGRVVRASGTSENALRIAFLNWSKSAVLDELNHPAQLADILELESDLTLLEIAKIFPINQLDRDHDSDPPWDFGPVTLRRIDSSEAGA